MAETSGGGGSSHRRRERCNPWGCRLLQLQRLQQRCSPPPDAQHFAASNACSRRFGASVLSPLCVPCLYPVPPTSFPRLCHSFSLPFHCTFHTPPCVLWPSCRAAKDLVLLVSCHLFLPDTCRLQSMVCADGQSRRRAAAERARERAEGGKMGRQSRKHRGQFNGQGFMFGKKAQVSGPHKVIQSRVGTARRGGGRRKRLATAGATATGAQCMRASTLATLLWRMLARTGSHS